MPLYEYYCESCDGTFELLRHAREASRAQPCPSCDDDAERIVSRQWSAFIFREGFARRLPDDGGYWHLGKKVSKPITGPTDGVTHPELKKKQGPKPTTVEDIEKYEVLRGVKRDYDLTTGGNVKDQQLSDQEERLRRQLTTARGSQRTEREKQRVLRKEAAADRKAGQQLVQENAARRAAAAKRRKSDF